MVNEQTAPSTAGTADPRLAARAAAILAVLDEEQRAAAAAPGPALILATAGSGKSRVLAHRVAAIVARGDAPPRRILALCRTPREAQLLRARAERLLAAPLHGAWIDTAHDVCIRILRAHAAAVGRRSTFTVLDESEARVLIRGAARDAGAAEYSAARLQELIALAKLRRELPTGPVGEVYRRYEEELRAANAFDAEDLVRHVVELLEGDAALAAKYHRRFTHIVVDDFEDTSLVQRQLVGLLHGPHGDLLCAADEDQAIASAVGGDAPARDAFLELFPEGRIVPLEKSYRTSGRITHAAARLKRPRPEAGPPPQVHPMRRKGTRVVAAAFADEDEEAVLAVRWLARLARRQETPLRRTAILYRHSIQARPFEEALARAGIPYRVVYGPRFYDRREIKDLLAYLRLTVGGGDPVALARIANVPRRGIGPASVATIARLSRTARIGMAEAALRAASLPRVTAQRAGALADLGRLLTDLAEAARTHECISLIDYVIERSGYGGLLADLSRAEEETRREGIDELRGLARALHGPAVETLPLLFARVAQDEVTPITSGRPKQGEDAVQLLTVAEAKGHDFDIVFLTGFEEGLLPGLRAIRQGGEAIDAERRLAYVGMTRARNRLIITRALTRTIFGQRRPGEASRFLGEVGKRVRQFRVGHARPSLHRAATAPPVPDAHAEPEPAPVLRVVREGQRVVHPRYGPGLVVRVEPGAQPMVTVRFDGPKEPTLEPSQEATEKRLALAFARLQPA